MEPADCNRQIIAPSNRAESQRGYNIGRPDVNKPSSRDRTTSATYKEFEEIAEVNQSKRAAIGLIERDFMEAPFTSDGLERGLARGLELSREPCF